MPIFEHDDEMTDREFRRQQEKLNERAERMKAWEAKQAAQELEDEIAALGNGEFNLHLDSNWEDNEGTALIGA